MGEREGVPAYQAPSLAVNSRARGCGEGGIVLKKRQNRSRKAMEEEEGACRKISERKRDR